MPIIPRRLRSITRLMACLALCVVAAPSLAAPVPSAREEQRHLEACALRARAEARLARRTVEMRRMAIADLERALDLEPDDAACLLMLARADLQAGFLHQARRHLEVLAALQPQDAEARLGLAQVWRRDYLKYLDTLSLARSLGHLQAATTLDPGLGEAWLLRASLELEHGDAAAARRAAIGACSAEPGRAEGLLALGAARWRTGDAEGADSCFRVAVPRVRREVRERFEDLAPVATEADTALYNHLEPAQQREFARRFWARQDPDPTTARNEAWLEYHARVAQAYFLYYDARHHEWDERGEVYVRYGPPERVMYNPLGATLTSSASPNARFRFPSNTLVWDYPSLGMTVTMQDRTLSEYYLLPVSLDEDLDPRPDPEVLAALDATATPQARGVFPAHAHGERGLRLDTQLALFPQPTGAHVFSAIEVAGGAVDSLVAEAVVLDSTAHEVSRTRRMLAPSACDPERFRVADFADDLPPGTYLLALAVQAPGRRGAVRLPIEVPAVREGLVLSDLALTCDVPRVAGTSVRLEADPRGLVRGADPLTAYLEVRGLQSDSAGTARFEIDYDVRSAERDPRLWIQRVLQPREALPTIEVQRESEHRGAVRRQFVSIPVSSLPAGRYRLTVRVHDLASETRAERSVTFLRVP